MKVLGLSMITNIACPDRPAKTTAEEVCRLAALAEAIATKGQKVRFAGSLEEARARALLELRENDVFLTLGAGNVVEVGEAFLAEGLGR